jgi:hypothetical protein
MAVVGLHAGAGSRTVVETIAARLHGDDAPIGITRAPRPVLDEPDDAVGSRSAVLLPVGAVVATAASLAEAEDRLELIETVATDAGRRPIAICRVTGEGPVPVHGPDDASAMHDVLDRLQRRADGLVLVDGAWERRGFAAPDVTDAVILAVGSGYSRTPEHSAAAVRYMIETMTIAPCNALEKSAWEAATSSGHVVALDPDGRSVATLPPDLDDPGASMRVLEAYRVGTIAMPDGLTDALLAPLVRMPLRCSLVVRDPTRLLASPVYLKAWLKAGGRLRALRTTRILAIATNPVNPTGRDAEPGEFRRLVAEAVALPVHDVVQERDGSKRRSFKLWR